MIIYKCQYIAMLNYQRVVIICSHPLLLQHTWHTWPVWMFTVYRHTPASRSEPRWRKSCAAAALCPWCFHAKPPSYRNRPLPLSLQSWKITHWFPGGPLISPWVDDLTPAIARYYSASHPAAGEHDNDPWLAEAVVMPPSWPQTKPSSRSTGSFLLWKSRNFRAMMWESLEQE